MRIREQYPHDVVRDELRIPLADGTRLFARSWRPAVDEPVPALLEYLPFRSTDRTAQQDAQRHPWYAGHGYASVRVDVRGTGNSEGAPIDAHAEREVLDGVEVVEWLAAQPWCDGTVGMFGLSWGGCTALQVARRAPEPLKAVVAVCASDDRYDDDSYYLGGAVAGAETHAWAAALFASATEPPDPRYAGEDWRAQWLARLEELEPHLHTWLAHPLRDGYWRSECVREDYAAVRAAVLAVGGWHDPRRDTVFRLVEHLGALGTPVRGIVGPWAHQYPDEAAGPPTGFLQETLRWWDQWLKGEDRGVLDDPPLRSWIRGAAPDDATALDGAGRWVADASWPSPQVATTEIGLAQPAAANDAQPLPVRSPQQTGVEAGRLVPIGQPGDLPPDQRAEDGRSLCFDTVPLTGTLEILGRTRLRLRLSCPERRGTVIARLCDVAPDGASSLVTRGALNLLGRHGADRAEPWPAGESGEVEFALAAAGYAFPPGHRLRVALSSAYWPWIWPHPEGAGFAVDAANSALLLPVRDPEPDAAKPPISFAAPEQAEPLEVRALDAGGERRAGRAVARDVAAGLWAIDTDPGLGGARAYPDGLERTEFGRDRYWIQEDDPLSAHARSDWRLRLKRPEPEWDVRVIAVAETGCTAEAFVVENGVKCYDGAELVFERTWRKEIPR
jgi:putative CocE/NonD family hydrolase